MKNYNELLGIKSLRDHKKKLIGEKIKEQFRLGWIFDEWYEKLILAVICALAVWKIIEFF